MDTSATQDPSSQVGTPSPGSLRLVVPTERGETALTATDSPPPLRSAPRVEEGNVKVVSKRQIFCRQLLGECLTTHKDLKPVDVNFALEADCSGLSDEQLAVLTVHLCKTTDIGKFSLTYNFDVDVAMCRCLPCTSNCIICYNSSKV